MPENQNIGSFTYSIQGDDTPLKQLLKDYDASVKRLKVKLEFDARDLLAIQRPITIPVHLDLTGARRQLAGLGIPSMTPGAGQGAFQAMPYGGMGTGAEVRVKNFITNDIIGGIAAGMAMRGGPRINGSQAQNTTRRLTEDDIYIPNLGTTVRELRNTDWNRAENDLFNRLGANENVRRVYGRGGIHHRQEYGGNTPESWQSLKPGPMGFGTSAYGFHGPNINPFRLAARNAGTDLGAFGDDFSRTPLGRLLTQGLGQVSSVAGIVSVAAIVGAKWAVNNQDIINRSNIASTVQSNMGVRSVGTFNLGLRKDIEMQEAIPLLSFFNRFSSSFQSLKTIQALTENTEQYTTNMGISNRQTGRQLIASRYGSMLQPFEEARANVSAGRFGQQEAASAEITKVQRAIIEAEENLRKAGPPTTFSMGSVGSRGIELPNAEYAQASARLESLKRTLAAMMAEIEKTAGLTEEQMKQVTRQEGRHFANVYRNADIDKRMFEVQKQYDVSQNEYDARKMERLTIAKNYLMRIASTGDEQEKKYLRAQMASEIDWTFKKPMRGGYETSTSYSWLESNYKTTPDAFGTNGADWMKNAMVGALGFGGILGAGFTAPNAAEPTKELLNKLIDIENAIKETPRRDVYGN